MECALKSSLRKEMGVKVLAQQDDFLAVDGQNGVVCDDFFVDELLDLSNEDDVERDEPVEKREGDEKQRKCEEVEVEVGFAGKDEFSDIPTGEISVPAEDLWLSHFVEESFSEFPAAPFLAGATPEKPMEMVPVEKIQGRSGSGETRFATPVPAKARSKRVRSGGRVWSSLTESSATPTSSATSSSSCSSPTSPWLIYSHPNPVHSGPVRVWKKQRKTGPEAVAAAQLQPPRRCSHCGVQKTPQWRTGPLGAKTLCNACGVRFKSGRLLPEYRPACSPTFSSELHSNHHRKVMEMRRKKEAPPLPDSGLAPRVVASF